MTNAKASRMHTTTTSRTAINDRSNTQVAITSRLRNYVFEQNMINSPHNSLSRWSMSEWRVLESIMMWKTEWWPNVHRTEHGIWVMMMRREWHSLEASRRWRTVHVGSRQRRTSIQAVEAIETAHSVHSTHEQVRRGRHVGGKRTVDTVQHRERDRRAVNTWRQEGRGRRRTLLVAGSGKAGRRGNLSVGLGRGGLRDLLGVPSGRRAVGAVVIHHVRRASGVDGAVLVRAVSEHDSRVINVGGKWVMITAVKLKYAGVDGRRGRHLRGTTVLVVNLGMGRLMLWLLLRHLLLAPHQTHQEVGIRVTSRVRHGVLVVVLGLGRRRVWRVHGVDSGRYARLGRA